MASNMENNEITIENEQTLIETQLHLGKQVLTASLELLNDSKKRGFIFPLVVEGLDLKITIEREEVEQ